VALIGDSAFFHSGIPALCNAVRNEGDVLIVVLDNGGTRSTGGQPSAAAPRDLRGEEVFSLSISGLATACGVPHVQVIEASEEPQDLIRAFKEALVQQGPALVQVVL
jgi:indolepyruvate ferredoxin oxidoreductase alpha subunit